MSEREWEKQKTQRKRGEPLHDRALPVPSTRAAPPPNSLPAPRNLCHPQSLDAGILTADQCTANLWQLRISLPSFESSQSSESCAFQCRPTDVIHSGDARSARTRAAGFDRSQLDCAHSLHTLVK